MSRKEESSRFSMRKQKSYLTAGVIALVAIIAMAGIYYWKTANQKAEQQDTVIMAENEWSDEDVSGSSGEDASTDGDSDSESDSMSGSDSDGTNGSADGAGNDASAIEKNGTADSGSGSGKTASAGTETGSTTDGVSGSGASQSVALMSGQESTADIEGMTDASVETSAAVLVESQFSEADTLGWPISGNILMNYSMDQTVYFATLDQYKYNPALIIEGAVNDKVTASAAGTVLSVETTEETGETVSVDIGGGFQLIYGQLKDVQVSLGDSVEKGALIGFISEPTKYYSVEGSNLYFAMLKDGEPVNPMNYLE